MTPVKESAPAWISRPERSNMLMLRIMTWISLRLGRTPARAVLHGIATYFLLFAPAARAASRDYLQRVLPHKVRWRDMYRHFFSFAATIHDRVYLVNRRFDLFDISMHGQEVLDRLSSDGRGVLLLGAHLGSFEAIRALGRNCGDYRVAMAMYEANARKINGMLASINPEAKEDIIGLGNIDSMLKVKDYLDGGGVVGILADRSLEEGGDLREVTVLGGTAQLPLGPFRMAAILRRPLVFMVGLYLGGNRYAVHFEELADFSNIQRSERRQAVADAMDAYAKLIDRYCQAAPYNWFNFFNFWQVAPAADREIK